MVKKNLEKIIKKECERKGLVLAIENIKITPRGIGPALAEYTVLDVVMAIVEGSPSFEIIIEWIFR